MPTFVAIAVKHLGELDFVQWFHDGDTWRVRKDDQRWGGMCLGEFIDDTVDIVNKPPLHHVRVNGEWKPFTEQNLRDAIEAAS